MCTKCYDKCIDERGKYREGYQNSTEESNVELNEKQEENDHKLIDEIKYIRDDKLYCNICDKEHFIDPNFWEKKNSCCDNCTVF